MTHVLDRDIDPIAAIFVGDSRMATRCREFDWKRSALGEPQEWPQSLKTLASALLASRNPMLLFWGPDLIMLYNDAFAPSLGPQRDAFGLGAKGREFWTDVWAAVGSQIEGVMERGEAFWFENALVPIERNGRLDDAWWTYSYSPVRDDSGAVAGTLVICQETTQSVRAEARLLEANRELDIQRMRLTDVFARAPSFFAVLRGPEYRIDLANEAYFGLIGRRDVIGIPLAEVIPEVATPGFLGLLNGVMETGEPFIGREMLVAFANRSGRGPEDRYVDFVYQPITESDWMRSGVFVHGYDVTDHVLARRAVEEGAAERARAVDERERLLASAHAAREEAESANRAKSDFLAVMSHELRTPLNAIDGYAELMEMEVHGPLTDQQRQDLMRIRKSQRHLLGLINGVLSYTRVEAGVASFDLQPLPLFEILSLCETLIRQQMEHRGLIFVVDYCSPDLKVIADAEKLQQVVLNLLTNAHKFTAPGGKIRLHCSIMPTAVSVTVADTGRGIAKEQAARIFEPFVQVDARLTRTEEGVGLGLAISRDLAHGMNGEISLVSELGVGSAFTVTIPRA
ncbi:MAG: ATP-binding protein [Gemmatimonadaceae bacterium]